MFQDDLEVYLDRSNGSEFVLTAYQFYHRFKSIRQALEFDGILKSFYQQVGELKIRDSWVIRKAVARGNLSVEQPNLIYSSIESECDTESDESCLSEDSLYQNTSFCIESETETHQTESNNITIESSSNILTMEGLSEFDQSNLYSTAAEPHSDDQSNLVRDNLAEVDQDQSARDDTVSQINPEADKSGETPSSSNITAEDALITGSFLVSSKNEVPLVEDHPIIPGDIAILPDLEYRRTLELETLLLKLETNWSRNPTFKNLKLRMEKVIKFTKRKILDHYSRTDSFFPAFKFKINSEEKGSIRPVGTLLVEDLMRRLCVCIEENRNTDTQVPLYFKSFYKTISNKTISSTKDFLIPLVFDSMSHFEDMGESMHNFIRDVGDLIDMIADTDSKYAFREQIECLREVLTSLEDTAKTIMNSVEFLMVYLSMLSHHVHLTYILPVSVTSARMLLALHDFGGYVLEDITTLIIGNFKRWKIFVKKNDIILSYLGRV